MFVLGSAAFVAGSIAGQLQRASAHMQFVKSLDDRARFFQALQNVSRRLGGEDPIVVPIPSAAQRRVDVNGDTPLPVEGDVMWSDTEDAMQSAPTTGEGTPSLPLPAPRPLTRRPQPCHPYLKQH